MAEISVRGILRLSKPTRSLLIDHDLKGLDVEIEDTTGEEIITKKKKINSGCMKSPTAPKKKKYDPEKKSAKFCNLCVKTFSSIQTFNLHSHGVESTTMVGWESSIEGCDAAFATEQNLNRHLENIHEF